MKIPERGLLLVVSGPSGCGKGTVLKELFSRRGGLFYSVSATTRSARPGEKEGVNYFFLTREEFERQIRQGNMLEYAEYCGNYYGTPRSAAEEKLSRGFDVVLEIEVKGAMQVRRAMKEAVLVFIMPPSLKELERRLRERGTESEEDVQARLRKAREEIKCANLYDYIIINDEVHSAASRLMSVITAEKLRSCRVAWGNINAETIGE